jgi:hypothetical protein
VNPCSPEGWIVPALVVTSFVLILVINHEWRKDREVFTSSGPIRCHLWHRYSIAVDQVMMVTISNCNNSKNIYFVTCLMSRNPPCHIQHTIIFTDLHPIWILQRIGLDGMKLNIYFVVVQFISTPSFKDIQHLGIK